MPERLARRLYPAWVRRHATVLAFSIIVIAGFCALYRFEGLVNRVQTQGQQLQDSCQQRAIARAAVRAIVLDIYTQIAEVQVAVGIVPADPQTVEAAVNTALPPLVCD